MNPEDIEFQFTDENGTPHQEVKSPVFEKFFDLYEAQGILASHGVQYTSLDNSIRELETLARTTDPESMEWFDSKGYKVKK